MARNLHLAELAVEDEDGSHDAVANLARSLVFAGRLEEAVAVCQRERAQARGSARQTFLEVLVQAASGLRRFDLAEEALAELRTIDGAALSAQELDARLRYTQGDYAAALALVEAFPRTAPTGQAVQVLSRGQLVRVEIMSLHKLGRHEDAARLLCECIERGEFPFGMAEMTALLVAAGRPATTIAAVVPHRSVRELLLVAAQVPGAEQAHQGVQLLHAVLDGRGGEEQQEARLQALHEGVGFGAAVLQRVGLVDDHEVPGPRDHRVAVSVRARRRERGDDDAIAVPGSRVVRAARRDRELADQLLAPLPHERGRSQD